MKEKTTAQLDLAMTGALAFSVAAGLAARESTTGAWFVYLTYRTLRAWQAQTAQATKINRWTMLLCGVAAALTAVTLALRAVLAFTR